MNDEQLDHLIAGARRSFRPPPSPDLDTMWRNIDARRGHRQPQFRRLPAWWGLVGIAAALALSFTLGRWSVASRPAAGPAMTASTAASAATPVTSVTSDLLGQTAALLTAIPVTGEDPASDRRFAQQAGELLVTTRLLLDARASEGDPSLRALLEDLELVLAQVARLRAGETHTERELITEALQQQDLVPRIRIIAAGLSVGAD